MLAIGTIGYSVPRPPLLRETTIISVERELADELDQEAILGEFAQSSLELQNLLLLWKIRFK